MKTRLSKCITSALNENKIYVLSVIANLLLYLLTGVHPSQFCDIFLHGHSVCKPGFCIAYSVIFGRHSCHLQMPIHKVDKGAHFFSFKLFLPTQNDLNIKTYN